MADFLKVMTENPLFTIIGLGMSIIMSLMGVYLLWLRIVELRIKNKK